MTQCGYRWMSNHVLEQYIHVLSLRLPLVYAVIPFESYNIIDSRNELLS